MTQMQYCEERDILFHKPVVFMFTLGMFLQGDMFLRPQTFEDG